MAKTAKSKGKKVSASAWSGFCSECKAALTSADLFARQCTQCGIALSVQPEEEHVRMNGFPGIVVTRLFLYQFLLKQGWDPKPTGRLDSLDWWVWGAHKAVDAELTDEKTRDRLLRKVRHMYRPIERAAA